MPCARRERTPIIGHAIPGAIDQSTLVVVGFSAMGEPVTSG